MSKIIKRTLIGIAAFLTLVMLLISVALNFIFTSSRLTPIIRKSVEENITAKFECSSVDLTFFSSFPRFAVRIDDSRIITNAGDTLLSISEAYVAVNPVEFLLNKKISVPSLLLKDARIHAFIDNEGNANWDIMKMADASQHEEEKADSTHNSFELNGIEIGKIVFENGALVFDDRQNELYTTVSGLDMQVKGSFSDSISTLDLNMEALDILFYQKGQVLIKNLDVITKTAIEIDRTSYSYNIGKSEISLNGNRFTFEGKLKGDSITKTLDTDLAFSMKLPSFKNVLEMIPESVVKESKDIKAEGSVNMHATLKGVYGKDQLPELYVVAKINNAKAKYAEMPLGVDLLDLDAEGIVNLKDKKRSRLDIKSLKFKGASSEIELSGTVDNLLTDPCVSSSLNMKVNFTELSKTFPLAEGVKSEGSMETKLKTCIALSDIKNRDFGKLDIKGSIMIENVLLESPVDSFYFGVRQAGLAFGSNLNDRVDNERKNLLNAIVGFDKLKLDSRKLKADIGKAAVRIKTTDIKDTSAIASMDANIGFEYLEAFMTDSIFLRSGASKASVNIRPSKENKKIAVFGSELNFDSIRVWTPEISGKLTNAGFTLSTKRSEVNKKHWISRGIVGFESLSALTQSFPVPMSMHKSMLTLEEDAIVLNNADIRVGKSDIRFTGSLSNLKETFFNNGTLKGKLDINSDYIDCNEMVAAMNIKSDKVENDAVIADEPAAQIDSTTQIETFVVPDKIDFELNSTIGKVNLGAMTIENVRGLINVRNQCIELRDLSMHTLAADMSTSAVYKANGINNAYTGFDFNLRDIHVGKLVEFMPALDTLVPMLRSLDGLVNFRIAAESNLNNDMTPDIKSIQSVVNLRGDSLVLLDGETFTEISKMMRFKNRERNIIDSVSVDMEIKNGQILIHPFVISMDRYTAAVGGRHNLDMTYDYHISLLNSPVPFKVGVDVTGNMDDFKFRITKPKYKDLKTSVRTERIDSTSLVIKNRIKKVVIER